MICSAVLKEILEEIRADKAANEERIEGYEWRRNMQLRTAVREFKELYSLRQAKVIAYMCKVAGLSSVEHLGLTDSTPLVEQFERIFKIIPVCYRDLVLQEIYFGR